MIMHSKNPPLLFIQTNGDHPLVLDSEEEPEPQVQTQPRKQTKPKKEPPTEKEAKYCPVTVPVPGRMEKVEIEMEVREI